MSSLWNAIARTYERLWPLEAWPAEASEALLALRERFQSLVTLIPTRTFVRNEEWRASRDRAYADMYEQAAKGLDPEGAENTLGVSHAVWETHHGYAMGQFRAMLRQRLYPPHTKQSPALEGLVACPHGLPAAGTGYRARTGGIQRINHLLGRMPPLRALTASDLHVYYRLQAADRRPPYLIDELEEALGLRIVVTAKP